MTSALAPALTSLLSRSRLRPKSTLCTTTIDTFTTTVHTLLIRCVNRPDTYTVMTGRRSHQGNRRTQNDHPDQPQNFGHLHQPAEYSYEQTQDPTTYGYDLQYQGTPQSIMVPQRTNESLNIAVLQRYLPSVYAIVSIANYAVLYTFSPETSGWEKADVEGTLFICACMPEYIGESQAAIQKYSAVILNRRNLNNFMAELKSESDLDVNSEYVIMNVEEEDGSPKVYGIWIYDEEGKSTQGSRERNAAIMVECAKMAEQSRSAAMADLEQYTQQDPTQSQSDSRAPPARQMTMEELFTKQREADSGFSIHNHHTPPVSQQQQHQPPYHNQMPPPHQLPQSPLYRSLNPPGGAQQNIVSPNPIHGFSTTQAVHASAPSPLGQLPPQSSATPQFMSNSDTDFFRGPPRFAGDGTGGQQQQQHQQFLQHQQQLQQQAMYLEQRQQALMQQQIMLNQQAGMQQHQQGQMNGNDVLEQLFRTARGS